MGDEDRRFAGLSDDAADVVADGQPGLVVQGGERLVKEQKIRLEGQGADQGGPLAHAPGKLGGAGALKAAQPVGGQHLLQVPAGRIVQLFLDLQSQGHITVDGPPLK